MRRFSSYGPVDPDRHFCVPRRALVEACVAQLVDDPDKGGHYFTVWAPRQAGKTWLLRRAMEEIRARHGDRFLVGTMSMQGVVMEEGERDAEFFKRIPRLFKVGLDMDVDAPDSWEGFVSLFQRGSGVLDRPLVLLIDEFDNLPRTVIDRLVALFRDIYLNRHAYHLHGLALIGVRAVLGVESDRGSPFNIQRSLHVPNLTRDEVFEMFGQYQAESGQTVAEEVPEAVYRATRGQPGLVSWFGELLTDKYNPGPDQPISIETWEEAYASALAVEWNNTVLNLVAKARKEPYRAYVVKLFSESDIEFSLDREWCNYLYLNGIIDFETRKDPRGRKTHLCRFSCPFVQERLYNALSDDLVGEELPVRALDPRDALDDVFTSDGVDLARLLSRYQEHLERMKAAGIDP